jgi:hypothetical protein
MGVIALPPFGTDAMAPEELCDALHHQPFGPFRVVMTDGVGFDVRHPDLLMVGRRTATIGLAEKPGEIFYERTVKVDLLHIIRVEPLVSASARPHNGPI